jgi:hypothetical protein
MTCLPGSDISQLVIFENLSAIFQIPTWIDVGLIQYPQNGSKNANKVRQCMVEAVESPHWNFNITGPGIKWNCCDGFSGHRYSHLAILVRDYPKHVLIAQVVYG